MKKFVEIRSLNLKTGTRGEFHRRYFEKALPLLKILLLDNDEAQRFRYNACLPGTPSLYTNRSLTFCHSFRRLMFVA
jgi:hypothetical protein